CRYMLSNMYDYDPAVHARPIDELPELDRWALIRLNKLISNVRQGYEKFDFRQIIHELDYFCSVDMSSTYLDILKDRLYTFPKDSPLRRGSQMVLAKSVVALTKLMAPILSFTSEEVWQMLPPKVKAQEEWPSIHMANFPEPISVPDQQAVEARWKTLLALRTLVLGALEQQRREKVIGSSLEGKVGLEALPDRYAFLQPYEPDLPALFIVSQVQVKPVETIEKSDYLVSDSDLGVGVNVTKADGVKCERCWNYRSSVGSNSEHPTLCDRCIKAVA
ncbi:MAG: class I tRNA ligase family protein, partial [Nitrospirota bacterium]|nr:class I tRNA ligase family protein [Nitrospirota bacterium]